MSVTRTVEYAIPCRASHSIELAKTLPETFLVVRKPSGSSELVDILYESNWVRLMLESHGGVMPEEIAGIYQPDQQVAAEAHARQLLEAQ